MTAQGAGGSTGGTLRRLESVRWRLGAADMKAMAATQSASLVVHLRIDRLRGSRQDQRESHRRCFGVPQAAEFCADHPHPMNATLRALFPFAFATVAAFAQQATAAQGDLDLTFGGTGKVTTAIGDQESEGYGVAIDSYGRIVVAGRSVSGSPTQNADFAVVRYEADGSLDTTFNGTGKVTTDTGSLYDSANAIVIQSDGKILVAGQSTNPIGGASTFAVARYNEDGSLDTTLNGTGKVTTTVGVYSTGGSIALQTDGKFVVAGESSDGFAIVRYNGNGSLDTTFNGTGKATVNIGSGGQCRGLAIQSDGKIVVTGWINQNSNYDIAVVRFNPDGGLDTSFNGTGKVVTDFGSFDLAYSVAVQNDGKLVVAGSSLVRYNTTGSLDMSFGVNGRVISSSASIVIQRDGKLVLAGAKNLNFAVGRYNTDGSPDTSFNVTGIVTTDFGGGEGADAVAIASDWKIVVAGYSNASGRDQFAVARYVSEPDNDFDGIPDRYETGTGIYVSPEDTGTSPTIFDSDGDGLADGQEVNTFHSNPTIRDTDGDGFDDGFEVSTGFSPTSAASSPDAFSTALPAIEFRFAAASGVNYRIESSTDLSNWETIETPIVGAGGIVARFYPTEGQARRYFRARRN